MVDQFIWHSPMLSQHYWLISLIVSHMAYARQHNGVEADSTDNVQRTRECVFMPFSRFGWDTPNSEVAGGVGRALLTDV